MARSTALNRLAGHPRRSALPLFAHPAREAGRSDKPDGYMRSMALANG